jgi:hypothetical protein
VPSPMTRRPLKIRPSGEALFSAPHFENWLRTCAVAPSSGNSCAQFDNANSTNADGKSIDTRMRGSLSYPAYSGNGAGERGPRMWRQFNPVDGQQQSDDSQATIVSCFDRLEFYGFRTLSIGCFKM